MISPRPKHQAGDAQSGTWSTYNNPVLDSDKKGAESWNDFPFYPAPQMRNGFWPAMLFATGLLSATAADAAKGQLLFQKVCSTCHGDKGEGRTMGGQPFPTIAGLPGWYVETQLKNFRSDVRGAHGADRLGLMMRPIARSIASEEAVVDVAAYVEALPRAHPGRTIDEIVILKSGDVLVGSTYPKNNRAGDILVNVAGKDSVTIRQTDVQKLTRVSLDHGKAIYTGVCASCHGDKFQGNPDPSIKAPSHRALGDWYMLKQLQNFSDGIRGTHSKDVGGAKMRPIAKDVLKDMANQLKITPEEASASVVAYIFANRDSSGGTSSPAPAPTSAKP